MLYDPQTAQPQPSSPLLTALIDMRQYLTDPTKWNKGDFGPDTDGGCCVLGAYGVVTDQSIPEDGAKYMRKVLEKGEGREVVEALYEAVGRNPFVVTHRNNFSQTAHTVWSYNDSAIRTHEEILTLLDKAIATEAVKLKDAAHEHITA